MTTPLLQTQGLRKHYYLGSGLPGFKRMQTVRSVDSLDVCIDRGTTFGLVGESGCGKSTTAKLLLRLIDATEGSILFEGHEVQNATGAQLRAYRSNIQTVFQDPYGSLNPRMRVREIIAEPMIAAGGFSRADIDRRVSELLSLVRLGPSAGKLSPHEFSGGQRQRIAIARALALKPRVLILDEPVSALDVSVRAQILNLLQDLQDELGLTYFMISHHLDLVAHMCDWIAVMYLGRVVEQGPAEAIVERPAHPYTRALFAAALPIDPSSKPPADRVSGEIPSPLDPPSGCHFRTRCPLAMPICAEIAPALVTDGERREVACHAAEVSAAR